MAVNTWSIMFTCILVRNVFKYLIVYITSKTKNSKILGDPIATIVHMKIHWHSTYMPNSMVYAAIIGFLHLGPISVGRSMALSENLYNPIINSQKRNEMDDALYM